MGLNTRAGTRVWVRWVWVWVSIRVPVRNPHPYDGFGRVLFSKSTILNTANSLVYILYPKISTVETVNASRVTPTTMAPAPSKLAGPSTTQSNSERVGQRKRKPSSKITDENFVGAETNVVTKRLKSLADAARASRATAVNHQQTQSSVEDVEDEDNSPVNNSPKNPNAVLEAADGSEDSDVELLDKDPELEDAEEGGDDGDDMDEPWISKPPESAREQRRESKKTQ
jgi:hypothetical protein